MATFFNSDDLSEDHWLFLQFFLDLTLDELVIFGSQEILIVFQSAFVGTIPDLQVYLFEVEPHFQGNTILFFNEFWVVEVCFDLVKKKIHFFLDCCFLTKFEVVGDFSTSLMLLFDSVFKKYGKVVLKGLEDWHIDGFFRNLMELHGVSCMKDDFLWFSIHINRKVVNFDIFLGDVQNHIRVKIPQDLMLIRWVKVDFIDQIPMFNRQDLMINSQKYDILCVILNVQSTFFMIHYVIDMIRIFCLDLWASKVDLKAP